MLGLTLLPLTDELRTRFSFDAKLKGVLVMDIDPNSPAASKNIKAGDVITEAQQQAVDGPDDIQAAVDKVKKTGGKSVLLLVEDAKGDTRFVASSVLGQHEVGRSPLWHDRPILRSKTRPRLPHTFVGKARLHVL